MQRNVGKIDRTIRIIFGLGVSALAFIGPANPWFLLGLVPLATGLVGYCPPYAIFGIKTNKACAAGDTPNAAA
jgi:hypothetical protein